MEVFVIILATFVFLVLLGWFMLLYLDKCKHTWELDNHTIIPSRLQQMKELGIRPCGWNGFDLIQKHILVYKCQKCGKLKIIKEES